MDWKGISRRSGHLQSRETSVGIYKRELERRARSQREVERRRRRNGNDINPASPPFFPFASLSSPRPQKSHCRHRRVIPTPKINYQIGRAHKLSLSLARSPPLLTQTRNPIRCRKPASVRRGYKITTTSRLFNLK